MLQKINKKISAIPISQQKKIVDFIAKIILVALILLFQIYVLIVDAYSNCAVGLCVGSWGNVALYVFYGIADVSLLLYLFFLPLRFGNFFLSKGKAILATIIGANVVGTLFAIIELIKAIAF